MGAHMPRYTCGGQSQLLFFHHVGSRDKTQVVWFGSKLHLPQSHPPSTAFVSVDAPFPSLIILSFNISHYLQGQC